MGWYSSVLKAFYAWRPQKRFKHWPLPLANFFLYPWCTAANPEVYHMSKFLWIHILCRTLWFRNVIDVFMQRKSLQSLAITLRFIYHVPLEIFWMKWTHFWKAAVCLLLSLRVIPYPVQKNCICSTISKRLLKRMPEQVKSRRTHRYLRNLWLLSFLSCCTERRGSLSPWAEQALMSYLGRPPHSRQIQLDTHTVDKSEGLEHVQVFIQNRQVNETGLANTHCFFPLPLPTHTDIAHEQINLH